VCSDCLKKVVKKKKKKSWLPGEESAHRSREIAVFTRSHERMYVCKEVIHITTEVLYCEDPKERGDDSRRAW